MMSRDKESRAGNDECSSPFVIRHASFRHSVTVTAASRIHFGMFSFGRTDARQFGGVGAMIDAPGVVVRVEEADEFSATGLHAARAAAFAELTSRALDLPEPPECTVHVASAPPEHTGLGLGTSLGLSVAAALAAYVGRPTGDPKALADYVRRGRRSAVGTYGFARGGLIVEAGKYEAQRLAPLVARVEMPSAWRFVLLRPTTRAGLAGNDEQQAFNRLPPVPADVTDRLCREALLHLVPAAREGCFDEFSASLYRYGHLAGTCFAAAQGGPYAGPRLQTLVDWLRGRGIEGVGQTSWGPMLFALLPNQGEAESLVAELRRNDATRDLDLTIAAPQNRPARVAVAED
jgi:beta-RFAP synthase